VDFRNLVRSQENQALIEREARLHQAQLEEEAEARKEQKYKAALLGALRAEIASLFGAVTDAQNHVSTLILLEQFLKQSGQPPTTKTIALRTLETPVFKANISNLGVLGAYLGADIIKVLSRANGKDLKIEQAQPMPHDAVITIYEGNRSSLRKWGSDLYHVAMRIIAYEDGTPDPGTLIETQNKRYEQLEELIGKNLEPDHTVG
jgi:hypothetical protein